MYSALGRTNEGERMTNESAARLELFRRLTKSTGKWVGQETEFLVSDNFEIPDNEISNATIVPA